MRRIVIVLVSALVLFATTLMGTGHFFENKIKHVTDSVNTIEMLELKEHLTSKLMMSEEGVSSFLSGTFECPDYVLNGDTITRFAVSKEDERTLANWIYGSLQDFLKVNKYFKSAGLWIDESICQNGKEYGYRSDNGNGEVIIALQDREEILKVPGSRYVQPDTYKRLKETGQGQWSMPRKDSPHYREELLYYVPIYCMDGRFFGVFSISVSMKEAYKLLKNHMPFGEDRSLIVVTDTLGTVIGSLPRDYEQDEVSSELQELFNKADNNAKGNLTSVEFKGDEYYLYLNIIPSTQWRIYTLCSIEAMYNKLNNIRISIILVSVIAMILMLICCVVIFQQVKQNIRAKMAVDQEVKLAATVQMSMLKENKYTFENKADTSKETENANTIANLETYILPAKSVGGDLYDYTEVDGKLIFCIGDVSGKGMPASLFMAQVISLFRNAVNSTSKPEKIIEQINNVLSQNNPNSTFCTLFVAVLDGTTLHYCNAGHNQPVFISHKDGKPEFMPVLSNIPIGIAEGLPYTAEQCQLQPGDAIVLYTDGVTEATNKSEECYGDDRLIQSLTHVSSNYIDTVLGSVHSFVKGYEQSDDITLLSIKI